MFVSVEMLVEVGVPFMAELMFMIFFAVSFAFLRLRSSKAPKKTSSTCSSCTPQSFIAGTVEQKFACGDMEGVVGAWRAANAKSPTPADTLRLVARAFAAVDRERLVPELLEHLQTHSSEFSLTNKVVNVVLEAVACSPGGAVVAEELCNAFESKLGLPRSLQMKEALVGAYAAAGDEVAVDSLLAEIKAADQKISPRCIAMVIRGFQMQGKLDAALGHMLGMSSQGRRVPAPAVVELMRLACAASRSQEVLERTRNIVPLNPDAVALLLEDCLKNNNVALASLVEEMAKESSVSLNVFAYDSLLKLYADAGDTRALSRFDDMNNAGLRISEGLCVGLISRCAAPKFRLFAEKVFEFQRSRGPVRLNMYSALMKVYAYDGLYNKACALYSEILERGLEPDSIMYGCLIKFASESGQVDLLSALLERAPQLSTQHYMYLIRACGQVHDVDKAFAFFRQFQKTGQSMDAVAYNVLLDVCASAGQMDRARAVVSEMKEGLADEVTYNVLLKGYCAAGDHANAEAVFREMEEVGRKPNTTAYNCLLNMAVSSGNILKVWETITMMEERSVLVDRYTIATLMKAVKLAQDPARDLDRTLALLDRSGIDICGDDVLLVTVLEVCIKQRNFPRIRTIVDQFWSSHSASRAMMHTHGLLIKANGMLGRLDRCWELWNTLVDNRLREPSSIVIGCMLDALVCNRCVGDAVKLLHDIKARGFQTNTVMYSTIMKGFSVERNTRGAWQLFQDLRADGLSPTTATFNSVIDVHARVGATCQVMLLLGQMEADGCEVNDVTHSMVIKGFCVAGNLEKALEIFYERCNTGKGSCTSAYNTLLDRCIKADRLDLSEQLVADMDRCNIHPTIFTLGSHIKHHGRCRRLDRAMDAVRRWPAKYGVHAGLAAKTCLVRTCFSCGSTDLGLALLREIKQAGEKLDNRALRSVVNGCVDGRLFHQAVSLIGEAFCLDSLGAGLAGRNELDVDIVENLVQALVRNGHRQSLAQPLVQKMQCAGFHTSEWLTAQVMDDTRGD